MALNLDVARAASFGNSARYDSIDYFRRPDPADPSRTVLDLSAVTHGWRGVLAMLLYPPTFCERVTGHRMEGTGWDWAQLPSLLLPGLLSFIAFMAIRYWCREPLSRFGLYMGVVTEKAENSVAYRRRLAEGKRGTAALSIKNQKKLFKFQNQLWLAIFYTLSSLFGYLVQRGDAWFQFPVDAEAAMHLLLPHPYNPPRLLMLYYYHGFGFYLAEMFSLLVLEKNVKRSDFLEYFLHHCFTVWLMVASHVGWEHKFGGYVLFLHDVSDILLCVSKVVHYVVDADKEREEAHNNNSSSRSSNRNSRGEVTNPYKKPFVFRYLLTEMTVNAIVVSFMGLFFFFRMYCLPMMSQATLFIGPNIRRCNVTVWSLVYMLSIFLQVLHVYWSVLMVTLAVKVVVFNGERKDIRSDSDGDEGEGEGEEEGEGSGNDTVVDRAVGKLTERTTGKEGMGSEGKSLSDCSCREALYRTVACSACGSDSPTSPEDLTRSSFSGDEVDAASGNGNSTAPEEKMTKEETTGAEERSSHAAAASTVAPLDYEKISDSGSTAASSGGVSPEAVTPTNTPSVSTTDAATAPASESVALRQSQEGQERCIDAAADHSQQQQQQREHTRTRRSERDRHSL